MGARMNSKIVLPGNTARRPGCSVFRHHAYLDQYKAIHLPKEIGDKYRGQIVHRVDRGRVLDNLTIRE